MGVRSDEQTKIETRNTVFISRDWKSLRPYETRNLTFSGMIDTP